MLTLLGVIAQIRYYQENMIRRNLRQGSQSDQTVEELLEQKWSSFYQANKDKVAGTQEEKESLLRRRIQRFFNQELATGQYFSKRRDLDPQQIDPGIVFQKALLLYGIDYLTLNQIRLYFAPYLVNITLYDDSHCSVQFTTSFELLECINSKLIAPCQNSQILEAYFSSNPEERLCWREIKGYKEMLFERKLWVRFLTKGDYDDANNGSSYMKDIFNRAKLKFLNSVSKTQRPIHRRQKWRAPTKIEEQRETCGEECNHCKKKFEQVKRMYPCPHNEMPKKEEDNNKQMKPPMRSEKIDGNRWVNRRNGNIGSVMAPNQHKYTPLPIIQKLTDGNQRIPEATKAEENKSSSKIGSHLYSQMVHEFSRYEIFGDKTNVSDILKNPQSNQGSFMSKGDISIFEKDDADI